MRRETGSRGLALAAIAVAVTALLGGATSAAAAVYAPPPGKVFWGGQGGYDESNVSDFARQSGKKPAIYQFFVSWGDLSFIEGRLRVAQATRTRPMLAISTKGTGFTSRSVAQGASDGFLVGLNARLARQPGPVYVRPQSEMNNGNNPYSPYDVAGRSRGPAYSVEAFKASWRRTALILRGGSVSAINRTLARLRLPPMRTGLDVLPRPQVALLWVPLSFGNPEIERNHPRHFWPGSSYVDWVGTTWYSPFGNASAFDRFAGYRTWRSKPFVFAEFAVWGAENPPFIGKVFGFARSHRQVRMLVYYQSAGLKAAFRLSTHPRSRAALRRAVRSSRYTGTVPEYAGGSRGR